MASPFLPVRRKVTTCSFCRRTNRETGRQMEGPWRVWGGRAYICAICVERCVKLVAQARAAGHIPAKSDAVASPPQ
jgi:hypothetical protein